MGDFSRDHDENSAAIRLTGTVTVIAMIVLFVVVVFVICLYLYAKWFWWGVIESGPNGQYSRRNRRRFVFVPGQDTAVLGLRRGLEPSILRALPVVVFSSEECKDGLECAVCLCEVVQGEKARLLPKCNHGFHVDCIDMWFQSHSTCPLCRNPVGLENPGGCKLSSEEGVSSSLEGISVDGSLGENHSFPANVLFWGNENNVNSRSVGSEEGPSSAGPSSSISRPEGMLVIDIPRHMSEGLSSVSPLSSRFVEEEAKSPMTTRLRSLTRLLSREKRSSPCSHGSGDLEQIGRGQS